MTELATFYHEKAKDFLKTVVCFDDKAYKTSQVDAAISRTAKKDSDGFQDEEKESGSNFSEKDKPKKDEHEPIGSSKEVDPKVLTDSFANMGILCTVIEPDTNEATARVQIKKMARIADVAIIDWELRNQQGEKDVSIARDAIVDIIKEDDKSGGCLRLIVIYSDGVGTDIISELAELLKENGFSVSGNCLELQNGHSLVTFFHKSEVSYQELPTRVVDSFTKLTSGLLPAAALSAITVIRQHSHHLLATFPATLDGAFITHRCLIPDPNDAEQFLVDLFETEIGTLLTRSNIHEAVDGTKSEIWVRDRLPQEQLNCFIPLLKEYSTDKCKDFSGKIRELCGKKMSGKELGNKIFEILYSCADPKERERAKEEFSILSTLDVHRNNISCYESHPPRLRLGTIVRDLDTNTYLLCIQPLCDSTRIADDKETIFPFLALVIRSDAKDLDLCIPNKDTTEDVTWLSILPKPQQLVSYQFTGKSKAEAYVEANNFGPREEYIFQNSNGKKCFEWVADLKLGKAQRVASELAARIHTMGIDEFEWLRLQKSRAN